MGLLDMIMEKRYEQMPKRWGDITDQQIKTLREQRIEIEKELERLWEPYRPKFGETKILSNGDAQVWDGRRWLPIPYRQLEGEVKKKEDEIKYNVFEMINKLVLKFNESVDDMRKMGFGELETIEAQDHRIMLEDGKMEMWTVIKEQNTGRVLLQSQTILEKDYDKDEAVKMLNDAGMKLLADIFNLGISNAMHVIENIEEAKKRSSIA